MKKYISLVLTFIFVLTTSTFAANYVKPDEFKQWLETGKPVIIVDIQPHEEFKEHYFKGSIETNAFPVKTDEEKKRLDDVISKIEASKDDVIIVCPRGRSGASNTYDYLKSKEIPENRLYILEGGIAGWPYKDMLQTLVAVPYTESTEIEQFKTEVQRLLKRIEELEKRQTQAETKTIETEKKAIEAEKKALQTGYDNGFYISSADKNYYLKTNIAIQLRYTYLNFDKMVNSNNEDWNNFFLRRARVFFQGNAPNNEWTYFMHVQLEPQSAVNLHDAYVTWKKYPYAQIQFGRAKIPYGLEFWQSGFLLNGVERSIFSGETDVDGKDDTRKWPGGNANFQVSNEDSITKYPLGGLNLFRSQGIHLQGDIKLFSQDGFLQYWAGIYNGRNTKGSVSIDSNPLWVGRIAINPFGKYNLFQQGDIDYNKTPKVSFLISGAQYTDRLTQYRGTTDTNSDGYGDAVNATYDIEGKDYDIASLFRYKGFSLDVEYAYERLKQERSLGYKWDRFGYHFNVGYFVIPKRLELISRYAYVERIKDNDRTKSLTSGLGLVSVDGGTYNAVEDNLREYSLGMNYYFNGHRMKFSADYSYLGRELSPASAGISSISDQHDDRIRTMFQFFF